MMSMKEKGFRMKQGRYGNVMTITKKKKKKMFCNLNREIKNKRQPLKNLGIRN
jgi:hypothetical protein